jgi:predicted kinase
MHKLILVCGIPGSGKSTFAKSNFCDERVSPKYLYLSSDELRGKFGTGEEDQTVSGKVFSYMRSAARKSLSLGSNVVIDATNVNRKSRADFVKIGRETGAYIIAYCFDTPLDECKRRNKSRSRVVPEFVLNNMAARLDWPTTEEVDEVIYESKEKENNRG